MGSSTTHYASTKVLGTYELLENILAHLSFMDLIRAQQVCQGWRELATRSKILRFNLMLDGERNGENEEASWSSKIIKSKPLLTQAYDQIVPRIPWCYRLDNKDIECMLSWEAGLWESMLISQPAPTKVKLRFCLDVYASAVIEDPNGVRLGSVLAVIFDLLRVHYGIESTENKRGSKVALPRFNVDVLTFYANNA